MTQTSLSSTDIAKLTAVVTGGGFKRSATKEAAIKRFLAVADEKGIKGAAALLSKTFEVAEAALKPPMLATAAATPSDAVAKAKALREKTAGGTKPQPEKAAKAEAGDRPEFRVPEKVNVMMLDIMNEVGPAKVGKFRAAWIAKDPNGYGKLAPTQQKGIMRKALNRLVTDRKAKRHGSTFSVAVPK